MNRAKKIEIWTVWSLGDELALPKALLRVPATRFKKSDDLHRYLLSRGLFTRGNRERFRYFRWVRDEVPDEETAKRVVTDLRDYFSKIAADLGAECEIVP